MRVQLPLPTNLVLPLDDPLSKWASRLDPESLRRLAEVQRDLPGTSYATAEIRPAVGARLPRRRFHSKLRISSCCGWIGLRLTASGWCLMIRTIC